MFKSFLLFLDPLLHPADRARVLCLLLLVSLVVALLYGGTQPAVAGLIPNPPWDKLAHMTVFGGFSVLACIVLGTRTSLGPVLVVLVIALMDEGLQYFTPGRTADLFDIMADLTGAVAAMLLYRLLQAQAFRLRPAVSVG